MTVSQLWARILVLNPWPGSYSLVGSRAMHIPPSLFKSLQRYCDVWQDGAFGAEYSAQHAGKTAIHTGSSFCLPAVHTELFEGNDMSFFLKAVAGEIGLSRLAMN